MFKRIAEDIRTAFAEDPAARSLLEVIFCYPGLHAIWLHRIAHWLWSHKLCFLGRLLSQISRGLTGIEIHPGAKIGRRFFIDHGMGVVIGETAEIGDNVKIYQGVTLGALSFPKDESGHIIKGMKRHPKIGNNVIIYSGATLLGGKTIVGDDAVVGGNVWITDSIPSSIEVTIVPTKIRSKNINSINNSKSKVE